MSGFVQGQPPKWRRKTYKKEFARFYNHFLLLTMVSQNQLRGKSSFTPSVDLFVCKVQSVHNLHCMQAYSVSPIA